MSLASDLLDQATALACLDPQKPKQASLRRAISAAYYSLFHRLVDDAACRICANPALQPYIARSFSHTALKDSANKLIAQAKPSQQAWPRALLSMPMDAELINVCTTFVDLQALRHSADYDTAASFKRAEVIAAVSRAQAAHQDWAVARTTNNATVFLLLAARLLPDR